MPRLSATVIEVATSVAHKLAPGRPAISSDEEARAYLQTRLRLLSALMFGSFVILLLLMVLLYYNVFVISTEIFGRNGWLSPLAAAWLPNLIFIIFAVLGLRRLE